MINSPTVEPKKINETHGFMEFFILKQSININ